MSPPEPPKPVDPPIDPADPRRARLAVHPGLCVSCIYLKLADSGRSVFVRCGLADADPRFSRYPRLPVAACAGYRRAG